MDTFGRVLVVVGLLVAGLGGVFWLLGRTGVWPMPGDLVFRRGNMSIVFPIVTSIVVSVVLTVLVNVFFRR